MVSSCSAYGCTYRFKKGDNIRMFTFPRDPRLLARWLIAVRRKSWTPTPISKICGKHFQTGKNTTFSPHYSRSHKVSVH